MWYSYIKTTVLIAFYGLENSSRLSHLILITVLFGSWGRFYGPHFTDEEAEVKRD